MIGMDSRLAFSLASPVTWTSVTNLLDFTSPTETAARVEKTVYSRTSSLRRYEPGLSDVADQTFTVKQDLGDAVQAQLYAAKEARTLLWFRAEYATNDAGTLFIGFEWQGRIADFKPAAPKDGLQTTQFSIQFDGDAIYKDGAPGATQIT